MNKLFKNHNLAKAISDCSWGNFTNILEYKCNWYGKNFVKIGRFEPSSKICNVCGTINQSLTLKDREWTCNSCGTMHDRDVNASLNIKKFGLQKQNLIQVEII
jgi:putative transposase